MLHDILIINGDPAERTILSKWIRDKLLFQTTEMEYGPQTDHYLTAIEGKKPDLILFDISRISMPGKRVALIRKLVPDIPIIILTQYGDYEGAMLSINAGAHDFLIKPVALERMKVTFRNIMLLRDLRRANDNQIRLSNTDHFMFSLFSEDGNIRRIYDLEKEAIVRAVQYYNGRMSEVARRLGIGRSTLYRKLNGNRITENMV